MLGDARSRDARHRGSGSDLAQGDHVRAAVHRERRRDHAALGRPSSPSSRRISASRSKHDGHRLPRHHRGAQVQEGGDRRTSGPKSYVEASNNNYANVEPIAQLQLANGSLGYRSCLIVHADSDIFSPEDIAGKTFAFNDPNSTSGYLVPSTFFLDGDGHRSEEALLQADVLGLARGVDPRGGQQEGRGGLDQSARSAAAHARGQGAARRPRGSSGSRS